MKKKIPRPPANGLTRRCTHCKDKKSLDDFRWRPDRCNWETNCHLCEIEWKRNRNHTEDSRRGYRNRTKQILASNRRYRQRNEEKLRAKGAVGYAIKTGRLVRKPCEVCGNNRSQAHHSNYNFYYRVRWLCQKHHSQLSRKY